MINDELPSQATHFLKCLINGYFLKAISQA